MNIDVEILKKILADGIQKHIKKIIIFDQVNFIPEKQGWINIQALLHVIHHINKLEERSHVIISVVL